MYMWNITSSNKLPLALVFAGIIVLGAISINSIFSITGTIKPEPKVTTENNEVTVAQTKVRERIQPTRNLTTVNIDQESSENYEIPDTLTAKASISLIKNMILSMGNEKLAQQSDTLAQVTAQRAIIEMRTEAVTLADIKTGNITARNYANTAAEIILENDLQGMENEITLLNRALPEGEGGDSYEQLDRLATMYNNITDELAGLTVPPELAQEHVYLINAFNAMGASLTDMGQTEIDPMRTYIRLNRYTEDVKAMEFAMQNLAMALINTQEEFRPNDPALLFASLLPKVN